MIEAPQAGTKARRVEIKQQSGWTSRELQIRNHLRRVNRVESLDRLQFDDNDVLNPRPKYPVNFDGAPDDQLRQAINSRIIKIHSAA